MLYVLTLHPPTALIVTILAVYTLAQIAYKKFWQPYVLGKNPDPGILPTSPP